MSPLAITASSGNTGMSLIRRSVMSADAASSPFQQIHLVDICGNFPTEDDDDDGESHGGFSRRDGDDEQRDKLASHGLEIMGKGDEIDVRRVQHDLHRHQHDDEIPPDQYAEQTGDEEHGADRNVRA